MADLEFKDFVSIVLLYGRSLVGDAWIEEHVFECPDMPRSFGGGIAVEPRYVDAIVTGALEAGLTVKVYGKLYVQEKAA